MAISYSTLSQPVSKQVVDPATGKMREEWALYFDQLTTRLNSAVGELGTDPAPANAEYVVGALSGSLSAERLLTNTATVTWDVATPGQAKANIVDAYVNATGDTMTGNLTINQTAAGNSTLTIIGGQSGGLGNPNIEMGRVDGTVSLPHIDFHSGATPVDYDARIIGSGGTGVQGGGTLTINAATLLHGSNQIAAPASAANGDLMYYNGTNWIRVAAGLNGQHLRANGAALPTWEYPGWTLLNANSVVNAATLDIVLTGFTGYRELKLFLRNFLPATDDSALNVRFSTNGGSSYDAGATDYGYATVTTRSGSATPAGVGNAAAAEIRLTVAGASDTRSVSNVAGEGGLSGELTLLGRTVTGVRTRLNWHVGYVAANAEYKLEMGSGARNTAQDTDAIRLFFNAGNITSGDWALYGLL